MFSNPLKAITTDSQHSLTVERFDPSTQEVLIAAGNGGHTMQTDGQGSWYPVPVEQRDKVKLNNELPFLMVPVATYDADPMSFKDVVCQLADRREKYLNSDGVNYYAYYRYKAKVVDGVATLNLTFEMVHHLRQSTIILYEGVDNPRATGLYAVISEIAIYDTANSELIAKVRGCFIPLAYQDDSLSISIQIDGASEAAK